jgi:hypothetical protein
MKHITELTRQMSAEWRAGDDESAALAEIKMRALAARGVREPKR